jgi:hypothetical protein
MVVDGALAWFPCTERCAAYYLQARFGKVDVSDDHPDGFGVVGTLPFCRVGGFHV